MLINVAMFSSTDPETGETENHRFGDESFVEVNITAVNAWQDLLLAGHTMGDIRIRKMRAEDFFA
jgi:hypothetical protein